MNENARALQTENPCAKILLIEDDHGNIIFLKLLIESAGYSCTVAETGKAALQALKSDCFALILLDLHLPDMDGYTLCGHIADQLPEMLTPIVGLSAEVDPQIRQKCINTGMKNLYSKSLAPDNLKEIINTHIAKATA